MPLSLTSISPKMGKAAESRLLITVTGDGFTQKSVLKMKGSHVSVTVDDFNVDSATQISGHISYSQTVTIADQVTVIVEDGGEKAELPGAFFIDEFKKP